MSASKKKKPGKVKDIDKTKIEPKKEKEEAGGEDTPQTDPHPVSVAIVEAQPMDSECDFCKAPIYTGKAIKCDTCGVIIHQFCFNSHAILKHRPDHTVVDVITESVYDDTGAFRGQKSTYQVVANV